MNVKYRRATSMVWEDAIALGWYEDYAGGEKFFILRWSDLLQDFEDVLVPTSRIRIPS